MNTEKILITGAHGFVGARAMSFFEGATAIPSELVRGRGEALAEFIRKNEPSLIVNAAAISDIGACEKDPEGSCEANVLLPVALARLSREIGAKLISFSSDQVYTGCTHDGPYREDETLPTPTNVYARHKLEAEERVLDIDPEAVLLRATWMYDMPMYGHANRGNFLVNTLAALAHDREFVCSSLEYRGITYVRQVVELLVAAATLPGGVYNYGSENPLDMVKTTVALLDALGVDVAVRDNCLKRRNLWMNCAKLRERGILFDSTAEGFIRCARDYSLRR